MRGWRAVAAAIARVFKVPGSGRCPWHDEELVFGDEMLGWRAARCLSCAREGLA